MKDEEIKKIVCSECSEHWFKNNEHCIDCPAATAITNKIKTYISDTLSARDKEIKDEIERIFFSPDNTIGNTGNTFVVTREQWQALKSKLGIKE